MLLQRSLGADWRSQGDTCVTFGLRRNCLCEQEKSCIVKWHELVKSGPVGGGEIMVVGLCLVRFGAGFTGDGWNSRCGMVLA
jgi:hypothetical protein